jgi:cellulose synthase/poly-beta-1,6-N-acetylglucosamine synthase-like glycosyltransferase
MIDFVQVVLTLSFALVFYTYIGYPILLLTLRVLLPRKDIIRKNITPAVSLLISCHNEENVIREKIENSLSLDYPREKLEIIVVSDASTDKTEDIVKEYENRGVRLIRQEQNLGKTSALNLAVPSAQGEIIIFTDANAMYRKDAVRMLVRNFADSRVGYVVGEARYSDTGMSAASKSENTYWKFEVFLKRLESRTHSVVGGDGAIYAIRKFLYKRLLATDINDFVNPLQIILEGYRGVFEHDAVCWEEAAGDFDMEFYRKLRIINRSFNGLMRIKSVMNPFKTGLFSLQIISHKLLRWTAPVIIMLMIFASLILSYAGIRFYSWVSLLLLSFCLIAYVGYLLSSKDEIPPVFYYPYYFILVSFASVVGIVRSIRGNVQTTWHHIREKNHNIWREKPHRRIFIHIISLSVFVLWLRVLGDIVGHPLFLWTAVYYLSIMSLLYIYIGYPIVLSILSRFCFLKVDRGDVRPEVCILVCAYNEEDVIREKILNSLELDYPADRLSVVVASDGSSDRTNEIVRQYAGNRIRLVEYPERRGKVSVINDTVPLIDAEIIIFSDANAMYQRDAVKKIVRNFHDPSVGAVSADVVLHSEKTKFGESESLYYRYERWIQKKESEIGSIIGADGGMYAIRKNLFMPPSSNIIIDDFVISMNVTLQGKRLIYDEEAIGHEQNTNSPLVEFLRKSRVVAGGIQSILQKEGVPTLRQKRLFFSYLSHKFLRWMIPVILILLMSSNIVLYVPGNDYYLLTLCIQILFYTLALADLLVSRYRIMKLTSIPFYFCLVNGAALYGIYKGLFDKQPVMWEKFGRTFHEEQPA